MAAEAEAAREARAKVVAAEGEQKASRALKEASDVISDYPAALQLRYLQTLNQISNEKNSSIIFPIPVDLICNMVEGMRKRAGGDVTAELQRKATKIMKLPIVKALG
jgi:erythrocyte band 7 integral membrane protein